MYERNDRDLWVRAECFYFCEGEGDCEDIWRSGDVKNPRTEVKRSVSNLFAPCRSIGPRLAIDRLSRDRSQEIPRSIGCVLGCRKCLLSRSIGVFLPSDRRWLGLSEGCDEAEPRSIALFRRSIGVESVPPKIFFFLASENQKQNY